MSFKEAVVSAFQNYATFSGRARRSEYWYFVLFNVIVNMAFLVLIAIAGEGGLANIISIINRLYSLAVFIPGLALCWRRLHDIGKSGAHFFVALIPLVGPILLLVWYCQDSQPGANMYGPNPKETEKYI